MKNRSEPKFRIRNSTKKALVAEEADMAKTFFSRLKGLLGTKGLAFNRGLAIVSCKQIHTFFMRYSLDVLFLNREGQVIGLSENLVPWRVSPYFYHGFYVLELPAGTIEKTCTQIGDKIDIGLIH